MEFEFTIRSGAKISLLQAPIAYHRQRQIGGRFAVRSPHDARQLSGPGRCRIDSISSPEDNAGGSVARHVQLVSFWAQSEHSDEDRRK
jgi:hypothetical protein